jgi:thymidine kinase
MAERSTYAKRSVVIVKPKRDDRAFFTHNNINPRVVIVYVEKASDIMYVSDYDEYYFDEAQFFETGDIISTIMRLADTGKKVVLAALNADSDQEPWPVVQALIPIVSDIRFYKGVCVECGSEEGSYTAYTAGAKDKVVVGGANESYICVCRDCLRKRHETQQTTS